MNTYDPTTGRITPLDADDPRLTARMPALKVVELPITDEERKAAYLAHFGPAKTK